MKKITSLILIVTLLASTMLLFSCDGMFRSKTTTTVGEIVYITQQGQQTCGEVHNDSDSIFRFYVYVKPLGQTKNNDWILFTVDSDTETESDKSSDLTKMPELSIGAIVEIVRNADIDRPNAESESFIHGFYAESIKRYDGDTDQLQGQEIQLSLNQKYDFDSNNTQFDLVSGGKIVGIVKVDDPLSGYIIYVHHDEGLRANYLLGKYWIDEETVMDDDMRSVIELGTTGVRISEAAATEFNPFNDENENVKALFRIFLDADGEK